MTSDAATIENGFAQAGEGLWLTGRSQPAVFCGAARRLRRKGWVVRDRGALDLVELSSARGVPDGTGAWMKCSESGRPFLTHIPCVSPVFAVSSKVLLAPAGARKEAATVRPVPMSARFAFPVTEFSSGWVVMATRSRTARIALGDGETASARPEACVAWTTKAPTGFCPKLSVWDVLLPRGPRDMALTFYGPGVLWVEGAGAVAPKRAGREVRRGF